MAAHDDLLHDVIRSPLFQDVSDQLRDRAARAAFKLHFAPQEAIVSQTARGEALFLLAEGRARVVRASSTGRERIVGFLYAPDVFGEAALLGAGERGATVLAETPVRVLALYRSELMTLLARDSKLVWNLARLLTRRVDALNEELIAASLPSEAGMAHLFLQLHKKRQAAGEPDPAWLPLTTADLTACMGTSRETTMRSLKRFASNRLVVSEATGLRLLDLQGIENVLYDAD